MRWSEGLAEVVRNALAKRSPTADDIVWEVRRWVEARGKALGVHIPVDKLRIGIALFHNQLVVEGKGDFYTNLCIKGYVIPYTWYRKHAGTILSGFHIMPLPFAGEEREEAPVYVIQHPVRGILEVQSQKEAKKLADDYAAQQNAWDGAPPLV